MARFGSLVFASKLAVLGIAFAVAGTSVCIAQQERRGEQQGFLRSASKKAPAVQASFSRVFENPTRRDSVAGEFFFFQPRTLYLEIEHPVHQIMVIDNEENVTKVYYPEKKRGFFLEGSRPAKFPVMSGVLAAIQPDYGLSEMGFEIYDQEIASDTLLTYWRRSQDGSSSSESRSGSGSRGGQTFVLARKGSRLTRAVLTLPSTDGTATTHFSEHVRRSGHVLPTVIETETVNVAGKAVERLAFSDLTVDPEIPLRIKNFTFPDEATVERKRW